MKISIFQPTYLSWLGFYKAVDWSDKFVFLDDVQFENHSWQTRNKIKSVQGELVLSVPIVRKFPQKINEVKINYSQNWLKKHMKSIKMCYGKMEFFDDFYSGLKNIYKSKPKKLLNLNVDIIKYVCEYLKIKADFSYSSDLKFENLYKNNKLISIINKFKANEYLYAEGAYKYMEKEIDKYNKNNIKLVPLKFNHPEYKQLHGKFISHMSIIDVIFNCGKEKTIEILNNIKL